MKTIALVQVEILIMYDFTLLYELPDSGSSIAYSNRSYCLQTIQLANNFSLTFLLRMSNS